ncbi:MAG: hypothetical protein PHC71_06130 [Candidatus Omnitrophica bacterium]|nr:hypothetical protein [Candidatus Omnitrophota bacterium]
MYLIIAAVAALLFYLGYRFHRYLENKYAHGIHDWRALWIFIGTIVTVVIVFFYYIGQLGDTSALDKKIERFKQEYKQKVDNLINAEYEQYYHECYYSVDNPKYVKKNFLNIRVLNPMSKEEFTAKYASQILPAGLALEAPQSEIDKITSQHKRNEENAKKLKRIYGIVIPTLILAGLGLLFVYNIRIFTNFFLAALVTFLQCIWFTIFLAGMLVIFYIIGVLLQERDKRRRELRGY